MSAGAHSAPGERGRVLDWLFALVKSRVFAAVVLIACVAIVVSGFTPANAVTWWNEHSLFTALVTGAALAAVTALVIGAVIAQRSAQRFGHVADIAFLSLGAEAFDVFTGLEFLLTGFRSPTNRSNIYELQGELEALPAVPGCGGDKPLVHRPLVAERVASHQWCERSPTAGWTS
jgi:hypothetical protein